MTDIVILICCTFAGFMFGKYLERATKHKGEFYADLIKYISMFKLNVNGRKLTLEQFNDEYMQNCTQSLACFLKNEKLNFSLSKAQTQQLATFKKCLDICYSKELAVNLEHQLLIFEEQNIVVQKQVKDSNTFAKLGALVGVMLGILLL